MVSYHERIKADYRIMLGKPVVKGTRLTVELLLGKLAQGATTSHLLTMYPHLEVADVQAVLEYAAALVAREEVIRVQV